MNRLIVIMLLTSIGSCSIDRTIVEASETENRILKKFQTLPGENRLKIADQDEPGQRLLLCLTLVNRADRKELSNRQVKFYHTSSTGNYEPIDQKDESTARLNGISATNDKGQIYIETILPGDYGSSEDNRHIHTTVFGATPEAYDIHFKQYTGFMGTDFIDGSDQHFLADLKKTQDDKLVCFLTMEVKHQDRSIN